MVIELVSVLFFIWLIIISWILFKTRNHYLQLVSSTKKGKLDEILEEIVQNDKTFASEISTIKKTINHLTDQSQFFIQKTGLVRFNPFEKSGGEQSFVVAFLDKKDTGLVMNFIYTREGLHVYTKKVKEGKALEYSLSDEEKKAIDISH